MQNFNALGLPDSLLQSLMAMQFNTPTPIQAQTIPSALSGRDILGSAQTGTGKTGAFSIPLITYLLTNLTRTAIVLTPTRELAVQVLNAIKMMQGKKSSFRSTLLIGGDSMFKQLTQLREKPRLIVGTPGRVNDHPERGTLNLDQTGFMVLDEMDRMLDMGFSIQLERIAKYIPNDRQTLMFSATMGSTVMKIAEKYLNDALRVSVGSTSKPTENVKQEVVRTTEPEKYGVLLDQMDLYAGTMIVFVKTKFGAEKLATKLRGHGHEADAIHGDLRQRSRDQVTKNFRAKKTRILVATDIAARGLDISHVECVVNFDLPQCPEDYIHRIGRTGRAGASGVAVNLLTPQDNIKWRNICKLLNPGAKDDPADRSYGGKKPFKPRGGSSFSSGGPRSGFRSERPRTDFKTDRPRDGARSERPRSDFNDRPRDGARSERPRSDFNDRPRDGARSERPRSDFNDRPRDGARSERPRSDFKPDRPRDNVWVERPRSDFNSDRPRDGVRSDRPRTDFKTDRPRDGARSDRPRTDFKTDRPRDGARSDRPRTDFKTDRPRDGARSDRPRTESGFDRDQRAKRELGSDKPKTFRKDFTKKG